MTKIVGSLPPGDANGLHVIANALVHDTEAHHVVIAVLKTKKITTDIDSGDVEATAKIVRIEVVHAQDKETAERLLRRAAERRHGGEQLPIEMEDEISAIFDNLWVDTATGEVLEQPGGEEGDDGSGS
jgi:hypothetical protein